MIDATPYVANEKGNLKLHVYTYYDKVLERFNEPIANRDEPSFVREGLRGTLTKGKGVELKGLILLYIGTFDCETGKFDLFDKPVALLDVDEVFEKLAEKEVNDA